MSVNVTISDAEVVKVSEVEYKGSNNYETRHVVVKSDPYGQYPQYHSINFNGDKADKLNKISVGDTVDVDVNLNGRSWDDPKTEETKYFNSLDGWKIKQTRKASEAPEYQPPVDLSTSADDDDLPF